MATTFLTITRKDFFDLLTRLAGTYRVFVPYRKGERLYFDRFDPKREASIELGSIRQSQPLKSFLNPPRESVADRAGRSVPPALLAGVKGCDLQSLTLQDYVFLGGDVQDPLYAANRGSTFIIGNDCTVARETCFCLAMQGEPYPLKYFDINLSPIDNGFLVEAGSDRGRTLLARYEKFFRQATRLEVEDRDRRRNEVRRQVRHYIDRRGTPDTTAIAGAVKKQYHLTQLWQDAASTCVECGACNLVCPTCHCFLLYDEKTRDAAARGRVWDACLYKTFARVAGGGNPRKHLWERLRNRFDKKFDFFPQVLNYFACTGCGRCIEACPGDIDIREVLKGAVSGTWNKPPHE